uniref:NADH-ubiquinone oxidoreductase chain 6 n=1 Tax=Labidostomis taxicornis TaxID=1425575 RepID=A0A3G1GRV1_9CUCU|nr:NADH dehydrogenase subunit 6 [Labidostomis taxicornis]
MIIMLILLSILFCLMNHPLTAGLVLLIQTITIALLSGTMNMNYWFSYIIFLVMIGGMLVLFVYMTSIASNEKFKFSISISSIIVTTVLLMVMSIFIESLTPVALLKMAETYPIDSMKDPSLMINKYLNYPHSLIYLTMVIYLLITLIAVVKITIKTKGALRQNF